MYIPIEIGAALIAGVVALIVSIITHYTTVSATKRQLVLEREKLEKSIRQPYIERLYDLRVKCYAEVFMITEKLKRYSATEENLQLHFRSVREELKEWKATEASFVMSDGALKMFYALRKELKKNPEKETLYSDTQLENIWRARNRFRGALRDDVKLLFEEDETA